MDYESDDESYNSEEETFKKIEKIKKIKLEEFLNFPKTRKILEIEHLDNYFDNCEKDIIKLYKQIIALNKNLSRLTQKVDTTLDIVKSFIPFLAIK